MLDKEYWRILPHPLGPSDDDVEIFKNNMLSGGPNLLLGCTQKLINLSDYQMDINPWYDGTNMIVQDWLTNEKDYLNIMLDGGLCFDKDLCDGILEMVSKHSKLFVARSFNYKLPTMRIASYFPKEEDFKIKPTKCIIFDDYTFYIWKF